MRQFIIFGLLVAALLFCCSTTFAQDQATQAAILQKLSDIDDKFNLIVGLLAIIAAFLALPYAPKLLERFKIKNDAQKLQSELDQLKTEMAQLTRLVQKPAP